MDLFSWEATLYVTLSVCLFVCSPFLIWNISLSSNIKNILEYSKRERFHIKNRQTTNEHTDVRNESEVLHLRRSVINWQRWLEVRTLVDNSITCLGWNYNHIQLKQDMELNLNPTQTGNGSMKRYASFKINCQLIADLRRGRTWNSKLVRSFMPFLYGG